jgi:hypothetical protein
MHMTLKKTGTPIGLLAASILALAVHTGCYKDSKEAMYPSTGCDTTTVTWSSNIQPIINSNCATSGCHDASSSSGGYALNTYSGVKTIANNGRLLAVIESGSMPKGAPKLDNCTINKVRRWINTGAMEN